MNRRASNNSQALFPGEITDSWRLASIGMVGRREKLRPWEDALTSLSPGSTLVIVPEIDALTHQDFDAILFHNGPIAESTLSKMAGTLSDTILFVCVPPDTPISTHRQIIPLVSSTPDSNRQLLMQLVLETLQNRRLQQLLRQQQRQFTIMQDELRKERDQIAFLVNTLPVTISWLDADLNYLAVNQQLANTFGLEPEAFKGHKLGFKMKKRPGGRKLVRFIEALFAEDEPALTTELALDVDGEEKHLYFLAHRYQSGRQAIVVGLDITDRKQAEQAQQRQLEELQVLHRIATLSTRVSHEDELISAASQIISDVFYSESFGFLMLDDATQELVVHPSYHAQHPLQQPRIPVSEGVTGQVVRTGRLVRSGDTRNQPNFVTGNMDYRSELCVPLMIGERVIGVINAESLQLDAFTFADERLLVTLANYLSSSIERIRAEARARFRSQQLETINQVSQQISSNLDPAGILAEIVELLATNMGFSGASVGIIQGESVFIEASHHPQSEGADGSGTKAAWQLGEGAIGEAALTGRPILIRDARRVVPQSSCSDRIEARSILAVPLYRKSAIFGVLSVYSQQPNAISSDDAELLSILAGQVSISIQNAYLYQKLQRQNQELSGLYETALATSGLLDRKQLFTTLYQQIQQILAPDVFIAALHEEHSDEMEVILSIEDGQPIQEWTDWRIPIDDGGLTGWVIRTGQTLHFNDIQHQTLPVPTVHTQRPARSWLGVPIIAHDIVLGAFSVQFFQPNVFTAAQRRFLESVAGQVGLVLENTRLFEETRHRNRELEMLVEISSQLRTASSTEEIVQIILERVVALVYGREGLFYLARSMDGALELRGHFPDERSDRHHAIPPQPIVKHTVHHERCTFEDENGALWPSHSRQATSLIRGIAVPLRAEKEIVGALHVTLAKGRHVPEEEIRLLTTIAEIAGGALHRAQILATLEQRVAQRTLELAKANQRLQELDRLKSKFVSDVSHELRTPISNFTLYLELLVDGQPEKRSHYLKVLKREANRLTDLIEPILDLSRLEMQECEKISIERIELNGLVGDVVQMYREQVESKHLKMTFKPDEHLPAIMGNAAQLTQVADQLISNSINFTPDGAIEIRTFYDVSDDKVCLQVADTGIGIPDNDRPHLFERFYRGEHANYAHVPGAGLGLAIVKEIVLIHNGNIEVQSQLGEGSVFRIWLPAAPEPKPNVLEGKDERAQQ